MIVSKYGIISDSPETQTVINRDAPGTDSACAFPLVREEGEWKAGRIIYPNSKSDSSDFVTTEDKLEEFEKSYVQDPDDPE